MCLLLGGSFYITQEKSLDDRAEALKKMRTKPYRVNEQ